MKIVYLLFIFHSCWGREFNQNLNSPSVNAKEGGMEIESILRVWIKTNEGLQSVSQHLVNQFGPFAYKLASSTVISPNCATSFEKLQRGIVEMRDWAYQMMDSSGKLRDGILSGNVVSLGDYDTCLDIDVFHFQGKYCRLEFEVPLPKHPVFGSPGEEFSKLFIGLDNETVISEMVRHVGYLETLNPQASVCIPSACAISDLREILSKAMQLSDTEVNVAVKSCEAKKDIGNISLFDYILIVLFASLLLLVLSATIVETYLRHRLSHNENYQKMLDSCLKRLLYFSLISNAEHLLRKDDKRDSIRVFHGMRVVSTFWIILGNTYLILYPVAYGSYLANKNIPKDFWFQFIANSSVAMETYFFISSTLLSYQISKARKMDLSIWGIVIRRYIRISIPLLAIMASICLLPHMNSGPLFNEIVGAQVNNCKTLGWMNFLYVNNFIPFPKMCLDVSWFLAADAQLYLLSIFVLIQFKNALKKTFFLVGILIVAGILMTIFSQILYGLPPTTLSWYSQVGDLMYILEKSQFLPHVHLPTYCVGLIVGYILATKNDVRVSEKNRFFLWILALIVGLGIVFGVLTWNKDVKELGSVFSVIYGCFYRILWALTLSWFTIECSYKNQSIVSRFLGSEIFVKLSRLSTLAYLTHMSVKLFHVGTTRRTISYDHMTMAYLFVSISSISFTLSVILNLFLKSPLLRMEEDYVIKSTKKEDREIK